MSERFRQPPDKEEFHTEVWRIVRTIPAGKVATYGQIAALVPLPQGIDPKTYRAFGPRWVGGAMAACPADVPWHRVVNAQGKISQRRGGGHDVQRRRLEAEGVSFSTADRIDMARFQWRDPSEPTQGMLPI